jgi:hypothetical protein
MNIIQKRQASEERERELLKRLLELPGADTIDPTNGQDVLALIHQQQAITRSIAELVPEKFL